MRRVTALALVALAASACAPSSPSFVGRPSSTPATETAGPQSSSPGPRSSTRVLFSHVVVVVMENKEYGAVIGDQRAPFINWLARQSGLATNAFAVAHPSLPNYLALIGGSTFGIASDCTDCHVSGSNLVDQLEHAGISWKAYMEGMPTPCFTGASAGLYAKKHDPFLYFNDIVNDPARCSKVVPLTQLSGDLARGSLPQFAWITPDLCHDTHDCGVATGDRFLQGLVPPLLRAIGQSGVLFLTWDEGSSNAGCCGPSGGGHVATIVAGPVVTPGFRSGVAISHYSILRTIETGLDLPALRQAGCTCTEPMSAFFVRL